MARTIEVELTQSDIDRGCRRMTMACPVARALRRYLPGPLRVDGSFVYWHDMGTRRAPMIIVLPRKVREFISRFDKGMTVSPFRFSVVLDPEWRPVIE